jgi:two-component system, cell cycle sensor histidine kinase and response regulator CckA
MNAPNQIKNRLEDLDQLVAQRTKELQSANDRLKKEIAERIQAQESLRLSEERFSKAFEASPIPLAIQSLLNEKFVDANASFLRLTGYSRDQLIGQTARQLRIWEDSEDECAMLERLGNEMSVRDLPCRFRARTERVLEILLSVELIELDGQPYLLAIAQDITEQTKLENQLCQAQKLEAVGQLAAGVAHDFNNILAVVQGNASLLLAGKTPGSSDFRPLQSICAAAEQAANLVGQLLTFCHQQTVELRPTELGGIFAAVVDKLPRILTPQVKVDVYAPPGLPSVRADAGMLESMLMNLAANARDSMPEGGQLSIIAELVTFGLSESLAHPRARAGEFVRLSVRDTGIGIPPEILPRIFEPFFTTKPSGQGAGLGLAAVYGIVKQHHGWVEVQSQVNHGTTFQIFLPVQASDHQQRPSSPPPEAPEGSTGCETILVVDDEPDLRELVAQILEAEGYRVLLAGSGAEALEQWAKRCGHIHLLLTDMVMPDGWSGRKLAGQLQSEDPRLRVLYTSGYTAGQAGMELASVEARNFLPKPYRPNTLLSVVRECLDHSGSSANASQQAA